MSPPNIVIHTSHHLLSSAPLIGQVQLPSPSPALDHLPISPKTPNPCYTSHHLLPLISSHPPRPSPALHRLPSTPYTLQYLIHLPFFLLPLPPPDSSLLQSPQLLTSCTPTSPLPAITSPPVASHHVLLHHHLIQSSPIHPSLPPPVTSSEPTANSSLHLRSTF